MKSLRTNILAIVPALATLLFVQTSIAQQSLNGIRLQDAYSHVVTIGAPTGGFTGSYNFRFPAALPSAGSLLYAGDGAGQASWLPAGSNGQVLSFSGGLPVWTTLSSLLGGLVEWDLSGNAVVSSYNGLLGSFLGTTSNQPLVLATTNILFPQPIEFFTNNAEKMRLTSGGELGIGLTPAAGKLLHVAGTSGTSNVRLESLSGATGTTGRIMFATDATGDLGALAFPASAGQVLTSSTTGALSWTSQNSGTVTSIGITVPSIFTVAPATITTSGTFALSLANQATGNQFFASPNGASGTPTFRSMLLADLPSIASNTILGNNTAGSAAPSALTTAQVKTLLNLTGTNSGDVTLAGTGTYLSLSGQAITQNPIDLSSANATGTLAAARFPALTGDVTTTAGSLATTIANNAVTYTKLQNTTSASVLLGRGSASAGTVQEITLGAGLTMTGQVLSSTSASSVTYNPGSQQATATNTGSNYLYDIAYAPGVVAQNDLGARITSTNTATSGSNRNATALTLSATATGTGTATGLVINTSGGSNQPQITLGGSAVSGIITTALPEVYYEETGDTYGTSRLHMQHRTGSNGALFETISNAGHPGTDLVDFGFKPGAGVQSNIRLEARSTFQRSALNLAATFPEEFQMYFGTTTGSSVNVFSVGPAATLLETGNFGIGYAAAPGTVAGSPLEKLDVHSTGTASNIILSNTGTSFTSGTPGLLKFQGTRDGVTSFQAGAQGSTNINYTLPVTTPTANQVLTATSVSAPNVTLGWTTPSGSSSSGATAQSTPGDPTGTTSTTGRMMGLAGSITPSSSGNVMIVISGSATNTTGGDGLTVQIRTGTGTAPANGAILTGTARGAKQQQDIGSSDGGKLRSFSVNAVVTGLSAGTTYWIDLGVSAVTGGTASVSDVSISAIEIQ